MDLTIDGENFGEVVMGFFRKLVKNILPYYFVKKYQMAHESKKLGNLPFVKEYDSYDNALKDCPTQNAYENTELCFAIADMTANYIKNLGKKPYMLNGTNIFLVAAIHNYFSMFPSDSITILDFGGACGDHYFYTRRLFPHDANIKWIVVETPGMVESAKKHDIENEDLVCIDDLKKINNPIDFVHCSGSLQYVSSPWVYLKQLIDFNPKYMLFNRMMFNENDRTFVTIQKSRLSENGPGPMPEKYNDREITYPHTTISYKEFSNIITQNGYGLEWSFEEKSGSHQINNEKIIGMGLLYKKCI